MKITISSSSSELIDKKYHEKSKEALEYLSDIGLDLNWGSGSISLMGLTYKEFASRNRKVNGYTTRKYCSDIENLPKATHKIYDDTLDLKKNIYNDADIVLCLPGGTGTVSEFFAYIEESRSNDNYKPVIIYNIDNHFDSLLKLIEDLVDRKFNSDSIYSYFKVANNLEELKEIIGEILPKNDIEI